MSDFFAQVKFILSTERLHLLIRAAKIQVPSEPVRISRAVQLLGNFSNGHRFSTKLESELKDLLGVFPKDVEEARLWKTALKATLKNLISKRNQKFNS